MRGDRVRFLRHLKRGRLKDIRTRGDFETHDTKQWEFGLLARARDVVDVGRDVADVRLKNEGGLGEYYGQIDDLARGLERREGACGSVRTALRDVPGMTVLSVAPLSKRRIFRCLETMKEFGRPARSEEIGVKMNEDGEGKKINGRHVNWILRKLPQLARRVRNSGRWEYELLPAGRAYVEAVALQRTRVEESLW